MSGEAAVLLTPHQYGVGVAAGAEKIIHSLQQVYARKQQLTRSRTTQSHSVAH